MQYQNANTILGLGGFSKVATPIFYYLNFFLDNIPNTLEHYPFILEHPTNTLEQYSFFLVHHTNTLEQYSFFLEHHPFTLEHHSPKNIVVLKRNYHGRNKKNIVLYNFCNKATLNNFK